MTLLRRLSPLFQLSEAREHFQIGCAMKPETTTSMADELNLMIKKRRRDLISTTLKWAFLMDIYLFGQQPTGSRTKGVVILNLLQV